jgi:catechol 2,3-dioxygenase
LSSPAQNTQANTTGLYHFALLLPSRVELAKSLKHMIQTETPLGGFSDHSVSEAIYLSDPDGNGIEIYRDRKRSEWPMRDGRLQMNTLPLDLQGLIGELNGRTPPGTACPLAPQWATSTCTSATWMKPRRFTATCWASTASCGMGLRPHLSRLAGTTTTLASTPGPGAGAPPPPAGAVGLRHYQIVLPSQDALAAVQSRLETIGIRFATENGVIALCDPSQNQIHLQAAA